MDFKNKGYSKIYSYAFTLEANMGYIRALTDMMLRTSKGILTIFPGIPTNFRENGCSFKNLRTYNNNKVSARYINKQLSFEIKLAKPETIRIYNNLGNNPSFLVDGEQVFTNSKVGEILSINAQKRIEFVGE